MSKYEVTAHFHGKKNSSMERTATRLKHNQDRAGSDSKRVVDYDPMLPTSEFEELNRIIDGDNISPNKQVLNVKSTALLPFDNSQK